MEEGLRRFMAEKRPADGHKRNVLNPQHNFVGLGCYLSPNQFSYYEEYLDRYYTFHDVPQAAVAPNKKTSITVSPEEDQYLYYLVAYYEKFPKKMKPKQLNKKGSYPDYTKSKALELHPWDLAQYRKGDRYDIPLSFSKPGLYYIHLFQHDKELKKVSNFSTKGKSQASGVVIRVEK